MKSFILQKVIAANYVLGDIVSVGNSITTDVLRIIQGVAGGYAAVQLGLAFISYMSKQEQKRSQAKDHMVHVFFGLVGVLVVQAIIAYIKIKASGWSV